MNKNKNIDGLIESALNSADDAKRATPAPFLLTRIHARLSKKQQSIWDKVSVFISRPAFAVPALAIVLSINIAAIFFSGTNNRSAATEQVSGDTADDLQFNGGSFYDIVNTTQQ